MGSVGGVVACLGIADGYGQVANRCVGDWLGVGSVGVVVGDLARRDARFGAVVVGRVAGVVVGSVGGVVAGLCIAKRFGWVNRSLDEVNFRPVHQFRRDVCRREIRTIAPVDGDHVCVAGA